MTEHDQIRQEHVSLREYFESRLASFKEYIESQIASLKEATTVAKASVDAHLALMNEFRKTVEDVLGTLRTQQVLFATKEEIALLREQLNKTPSRVEHQGLKAQIESLEITRATLAGKASQNAVILSVALSIAALIVGIIGIIMRFVK